MLKKFNLFNLVLLFILIINNAEAQDKIAFVDVNYILNNSAAGKNINKMIDDKTKKINSEFDSLKKKIENEKKILINQKKVISKEEYQKKLAQLEKNINEYNKIISQNNNDLLKFKNLAKVQFSNKLIPILEEYSKNNSIGMIIRKENLLIGKNSLDVTKGILDMFNDKVKKIVIK